VIEPLPKLRDNKPLVFIIAEEPDILNLAKMSKVDGMENYIQRLISMKTLLYSISTKLEI